ncbi:putative glutamyl-trna amidotransferase subunit a [Phaeomoniella chlamydospora]|uniref:Putative glutamyl-trna amidotransferase subunit a n=1 Tax=Phaeomoniella chlamydospora TaxID=158046 RepID=A0A0G2E744_PHACM|nr:putative glutamyl-trna amidotransferase subunit a [Phaeomoniella chlamydospora]
MSIVTLSSDSKSAISTSVIHDLAISAGIKIPDEHVDDWKTLIAGLDHCAKYVMEELDDYYPEVDYDLYPRTEISIPKYEDSDRGGWATKCTVISTAPKSNLLSGKTIALKDNIAVAGVRCTNGNTAVDWTPQIDATIVTRLLDAGAIIKGKATCENNCFGAVSDTSITGPVHNPWADEYSTGGSSSGCARLVASGAVDMAIGADQGGSIRLPSSNCGIVGFKPTWGLIPYTGVISLEATIDHAGPMAKNVPDTARLMDVLAGEDGLDDRIPYTVKVGDVQYAEGIQKRLQLPKEQRLKGLKIGILEEGFQDPKQDPNVEALVRSAAEKFTEFGAEVESCSIPLHKDAGMIWACALPMAGRRQLFLTDRHPPTPTPYLSQFAFDALGPGGQNIYLRHLHLTRNYGPRLHGKTMNILRRLTDSYNHAFRTYDILLTPTTPCPPVKILHSWNQGNPLERLVRTTGVSTNTAPFNSSGHPALSLPVGFVPAKDDTSVKLPAGMQLVGRQGEDLKVLEVAACWELEVQWKERFEERF